MQIGGLWRVFRCWVVCLYGLGCFRVLKIADCGLKITDWLIANCGLFIEMLVRKKNIKYYYSIVYIELFKPIV